MASKGLFAMGASRNLSVTYLRPSRRVKVGDVLRAEASCDRLVEKSRAFTSIRFFDGKDELVARGSNSK